MRSGNRSNRPRESSIWPAERIDSVRTCLLAGMTRLQTEQETGLTGNQLHYCRLRYLPELPAFARRGRGGKSLGAIKAMRAAGVSIAQMARNVGRRYEGGR